MLSIAIHSATYAAEIVLHAQCECRQPVVRLGDVAQVYSVDPAEMAALAQIELFTAPAGGSRRLTVRQLQDLLAARSVNLLACRFSGASEIRITAAQNHRAESLRPVTPAATAYAEERIAQAVLDCLHDRGGSRKSWRVNVQVDPQHVRLLGADVHHLVAHSDGEAVDGPREFRITAESTRGPVEFHVLADVSTARQVVVAAGPLQRGDVLRAGDLRIEPAAEGADVETMFESLDAVVGMELTRSVASSQPITRTDVQRRRLVQRGEVVTLYSRAAGVRVRTMGRALGEGAEGDVIDVELLDRQKRTRVANARVVGFQEVEVFAGATGVRPTAPRLAQPRLSRK